MKNRMKSPSSHRLSLFLIVFFLGVISWVVMFWRSESFYSIRENLYYYYRNDSAQSIYQKFLHIQRLYTERLSTLKTSQYKSASNYIEYATNVEQTLPNASTKVSKILLLTGFFGNFNLLPSSITCSGNLSCIGTHSKDDLLSSDAVLFHPRDMPKGLQNMPSQRLPNQSWIYFMFESPRYADTDIKQFNGVFNLTATYRTDADVHIPYYAAQPRKTRLDRETYNKSITTILASKSKLVAFVSSHCNSPYTTRDAFVKELQKYVQVDTFGNCGTLKCSMSTKECSAVLRQYKFHIAMENSYCRDYITEKAFLPLTEFMAVPVVMGGSDPREYEKALPPHSYIHASGFSSPKELAKYLVLLDMNPHLYQLYHEWRQTFNVVINLGFIWCDLCRVVTTKQSERRQTYRDFLGWYNEDICKS